MTGQAKIVMVLITAFVWGGFLLILLTAARKERGKTAVAGAGAGAVGGDERGGLPPHPADPH